MTSTDVVRSFFDAMEARDWDRAGDFLAPSVDVRFTATGERFVGTNFLAMQRAYPDGWHIDVVEILASGNRTAAQVRVVLDDEVFWCAGFYTVQDGRIVDGVEHWITADSETPPAWRIPFAARSNT
jgi:ketosteroid isomerase-like protein